MDTAQYIEDGNLSRAWARAFIAVTAQSEIQPLVVSVTGCTGSAPPEVLDIRYLLDAELRKRGCQEVSTVAGTMFPLSLWNPQASRQTLYERYLTILPRLKHRQRSNRNGLYFERLIAYGNDHVNQLEHVVTTWIGGNHRRSALFAAVVDPTIDHTHQRQRGFPCLQQVSFAPEGDNGFAITGFYSMQYIFKRAYGNYLGLFRIGAFVAHEIGRQLTRLTCVAAVAHRDISARDAAPLGNRLHKIINHA